MRTIVIVGRPNVGKSTLFNRLVGKRIAIVEEQPGVTRDYLVGSLEWRDLKMRIIDTGGVIPDPQEPIAQAIHQQVERVLREADVIFFVCDARSELTAADMHLADQIRPLQKPVILVANKCDDPKHDVEAYACAALGISETIVPCSALHGRNIDVLLEMALPFLQQASVPEEEADIPRIAIIGRPNVGKSSLLNALVGKERSIVTPIAGTTRDALDTRIRFYGKELLLIDTAGLRRKSRIRDNIEFFSTVRTRTAIRRSDVVILVVDALEGFHKQEKQMIDETLQEGKGVVIAVNKWDAVPSGQKQADHWRRSLVEAMPIVEYLPVLFVSARTKQRVPALLKTALQVYQKRQMRVATAKLNEMLQQWIRKTPPPSRNGKEVRLNYATQVETAPPHFVFFTNHPRWIPDFYKRYLERSLRESFAFEGVPLRISFRSKH